MDSLKNVCIEELTLLVTQTVAPVPATGLPIGDHTPELRFVL
jgi:hypothetical protein